MSDETSAENLVLAQVCDGDTATYRYLLFNGETKLSIRMKNGAECRVELYLDGMYHAEAKAEPTETYAEVSMPIQTVSGDREVTLKFYGNGLEASVESLTFA